VEEQAGSKRKSRGKNAKEIKVAVKPKSQAEQRHNTGIGPLSMPNIIDFLRYATWRRSEAQQTPYNALHRFMAFHDEDEEDDEDDEDYDDGIVYHHVGHGRLPARSISVVRGGRGPLRFPPRTGATLDNPIVIDDEPVPSSSSSASAAYSSSSSSSSSGATIDLTADDDNFEIIAISSQGRASTADISAESSERQTRKKRRA